MGALTLRLSKSQRPPRHLFFKPWQKKKSVTGLNHRCHRSIKNEVSHLSRKAELAGCFCEPKLEVLETLISILTQIYRQTRTHSVVAHRQNINSFTYGAEHTGVSQSINGKHTTWFYTQGPGFITLHETRFTHTAMRNDQSVYVKQGDEWRPQIIRGHNV